MTELTTAHTADLDPATLEAARALLDDAFEGDFSDQDWEHALGGVHALAWEGSGLVGHASLIQRRLLHGGRALRTGYVEGAGVRAGVHPILDRIYGYTGRMTVTDELLRNAQEYAANFDRGDLPLPPAKKIAVLACMDARLLPARLLGLEEGDAHVIRNAGGVVTDDGIRSLAISQRLLGTEEIILIHHTDCGMLTFTDDEFKRSVHDETGIKPEWAAESFSDLDEDVRQSVARIRASPFIPRKDSVRGFVYEVETGRLREVETT